MEDYNIQQLEKQCKEMKLKALEMSVKAGSFGAHIGGGFSAMELFVALYAVAHINDSFDDNRDRIILSKGHGVLAHYTALWQHGYITEEELSTFDQDGTQLHGHENRNLEKGIEFSGGSLGLGLSYATGVALACKQKGLNNRIFIVVGDGECDEGIVWESLMSIANFNLNNITLIVDKNCYQLDGPTNEIMNQLSIEKKLEAFGFDVTSVDGHNLNQLINAFEQRSDSPIAVVANTIKANGISFLMNNKLSHQIALTSKKYAQAVEDIKSYYEKQL